MDNSGNIDIGAPSMYPQKKGPDMTYIKIGGIALGVLLVLVSIGVAIWAFTQYSDMKNNFDSRLAASAEEASKSLETQYEQKYQDRLKEPYLTFNGPADYGSVKFSYPKTWNLYIAKDITASNYSGDYEAYLNPDAVPAVSTTQPFALRVNIVAKNYDSVVAEYANSVKNGDLKSKSATIDGVTGTRLDGKFTKDIEGAAILVKIRDKTLIMRTDKTSFVADFDKIMTSVTFVK